MRMHRDGGPAKWAALEGSIHEQLGSALWHVGRDPENLVVIFTGTGDSFLVENVPEEYPKGGDGWDFVRSTREGVDLILGFLDLDRPVITIANGPATYHSELPMLGDVVLAADDAYFQDSHIRKGVVPADGCHAVWLELLGTNRGRRFLMTAQTLTAQELLQFGVVGEVLPRPALLPRAHEIAAQWLRWSPTVLAYSHAALAGRSSAGWSTRSPSGSPSRAWASTRRPRSRPPTDGPVSVGRAPPGHDGGGAARAAGRPELRGRSSSKTPGAR